MPDAAAELEGRLRSVRYVEDARFEREVRAPLGQPMLFGEVTLIPTEHLPEDDPFLDSFYEALQPTFVDGYGGELPQAPGAFAERLAVSLELEELERHFRSRLDELESVRQSLLRTGATLAGNPPREALTDDEMSVAVALNVILTLLAKEWKAGSELHPGLVAAELAVANELGRRGLPNFCLPEEKDFPHGDNAREI